MLITQEPTIADLQAEIAALGTRTEIILPFDAECLASIEASLRMSMGHTLSRLNEERGQAGKSNGRRICVRVP